MDSRNYCLDSISISALHRSWSVRGKERLAVLDYGSATGVGTSGLVHRRMFLLVQYCWQCVLIMLFLLSKANRVKCFANMVLGGHTLHADFHFS